MRPHLLLDNRCIQIVFDVLQRVAEEDDRVLLLRHERNSGKGAAICTALQHETGEICIIHDADLEYHRGDIPALLVPFVRKAPTPPSAAAIFLRTGEH